MLPVSFGQSDRKTSKFLYCWLMLGLLCLLWPKPKVIAHTSDGDGSEHQNRLYLSLDFHKLRALFYVCSSSLCLLISFV
jgi:hypothetical protein